MQINELEGERDLDGDKGASGDAVREGKGEVTILAPGAPSAATTALVRRLARGSAIPEQLATALQGPLGAAITEAAGYAANALSPATQRAYAQGWAHFAEWCRAQGLAADDLPVHPVLIAAYLAHLAPTLGASALNGRVAAIAHEHRRRGLAWNGRHPAIRETLQGMRRTHGSRVRPAAAICSDEVKQLLAVCPSDLAGRRDAALFLLGLAGAFRRSELVAIDRAHLRFEPAHLVVHIPRSKADQAGKGADVTIPRMRDAAGRPSETCPVRALEAWIRRAKILYGPVFRSVTAGGRLGGRLSTDAVRLILLRRARAAKLTVHDSERLSPHGLRAGFITEAYLSGAPDEQVMAHTRHADLTSMRGYRKRARITTDNPARLLKL